MLQHETLERRFERQGRAEGFVEIEDGENIEQLSLILGDKGRELPRFYETRFGKDFGGQKGIVQARIAEYDRKPGIPGVFVKPTAGRTFAEGLPQIGGQHFYLADFVGRLEDGEERAEISSAQ